MYQRSRQQLCMQNPIDTHTYDGKLIERKCNIQDLLDCMSILDTNKKIQMMEKLKMEIFRVSNRRTVLHFMDMIISDFISYGNGKGPNYDPTNNMSADDLLCICHDILFSDDKTAGHIDKKDFVEILCLQLDDMASGSCPQGRVARLASVVFSFLGK